jgi:SNF2 family DNA or RNA helicase
MPDVNVHGERELYKHQAEDVYRFTGKSEIALFLDPGCGKSAIAIRIAGEKFLRGEIDSVVYIGPNQVHAQFCNAEIPKWLPSYVPRETQCLYGRGGAKTFRPFENKDALQFVCVNVDTFSTPKKWEAIVKWALARKTFVILDEASVVKSVGAKRTGRIVYGFNKTVKRGKQILSTKPLTVARAILTGTPVTNGPMDVYCPMEFLRPGFWGRNYYAFKKYFAMHTRMYISDSTGASRQIDVLLNEERWNDIKGMTSYGDALAAYGVSADTFVTVHAQSSYQGPYKHADELKKQLEEVASFRNLKDCVDMPCQTYVTRELVMDGKIREVYDEMAEMMIAEYGGDVTSAKNKMGALIRLQQISSGFIVRDFTEDELDDPPARCVTWISDTNDKLEAIMMDIEGSGKPVIVVTHFTAEAVRLYALLKDRYKTCLMTGWNKVGTIEDYQAGKYELMIANVRVIGRGFNLQNGSVMLFYSNTFSLEDRLQVEGRIWRIGQQSPCMYIDYVYADTVDTKIVSALQQKRSLLDYIRGASVEEVIKNA